MRAHGRLTAMDRRRAPLMIGIVKRVTDIPGAWPNRTFLFALALLLTVLGHALIPVGSPLARTTGSAFSASTADVSLGAARREAGVAAEQALEPPRPALAAIETVTRGVAPHWAVGTDRRGRPAAFQPFDARGPPAAAL